MESKEPSTNLQAKTVQDYVCQVVRSLLGSDEETKTLYSFLNDHAGKFEEFIKEGHFRRLVIRKNSEGAKTTFSVLTDIQIYGKEARSSVSVLIVKNVSILTASRPLSEQIYACHIKDGAPYEAMLNYIRHVFLPYSRFIMSSDKDVDMKEMDFNVLRAVNSKLSELEVSLLRCQQNIEIPQIQLQMHPLIQEIISQKGVGSMPSLEDLSKRKIDMDKFLNELTNILSDWKKLISSVTKLDRDISMGTTKEEIHFWGSMDRTLTKIKQQLEDTGVRFTFDILNANSRFMATTDFKEECNFTSCSEKVSTYNKLLRDFPIQPLIDAVTINDLKDGVTAIFKHLKKVGQMQYPLKRAIALVQTIAKDISLQLRSILNAKRPMFLSYEDFQRSTRDCKHLFQKWDTQLQLFYDDLRSYQHERNYSRARHVDIGDPVTALSSLKKRVLEVRQLRKDHYQLIAVIDSTLEKDSIVRQSSRKQIEDAYEYLKGVDVMDTSDESSGVWESAVKKYHAKIEYVEADLEETIRKLLDKAKGDANEMFRVCSKFNDLFVRPRIQAAIREYQQPLIGTVQEGITKLYQMFKRDYVNSEAYKMSLAKDLPPVSGAIIWLRQIENQLNQYMKRVEQVLGKKWHHHVVGKELRRNYANFRSQLEQTIHKDQFESWVKRWKRPKSSQESEGKIFRIEEHSNQPRLVINFDRDLVTLFKEVRNLNYISNIRVPYDIKLQAGEAKVKYPFAVRLEEVIKIFNRTSARLDEHPQLEPLAAKIKRKVQELIKWGVTQAVHWTSDYLKNFVSKLGNFTQQFQDYVDDIIAKNSLIEKCVRRLRVVDPSRDTLGRVVAKIQNIVDGFEKKGYSNLALWVGQLDRRIEAILSARLKELMKMWTDGVLMKNEEYDVLRSKLEEAETAEKKKMEFLSSIDVSESKAKKAGDTKTTQSLRTDSDEDENDDVASKEEIHERCILQIMRQEVLDPISHEITIKSNVLTLNPPLQHAKLRLSQSLQRLLNVICKLPRIQCWATKRVQGIGIIHEKNKSISARQHQNLLTFSASLKQLATQELDACYGAIEHRTAEAEKCVSSWLQYQALWDMDVDMVLREVEESVHNWEQLLRDMKMSRRAFDADAGAGHAQFGPIIIRYGKVQQKVTNKVDSWHKTMVGRFASRLGEKISQSYSAAANSRRALEELAMDFKSTDEVVKNITTLEELKKKANYWGKEIKAQAGVEKMLERQRYLFPSDWMYSERVVGEFASFQQILKQKLNILESETPDLQKKVTEEDLKITEHLQIFLDDWKTNRPVDGDLDHKKVTKSLTLFRATLTRLQSNVQKIEKAKQALGMSASNDTTLKPVQEELDGLQEVWGELGKVWNAVDALGEKRFLSFPPEKIRSEMKELQNILNGMPNHLRTYDAFDYLRTVLEGRQKLYVHMMTIGSPVLRKKHQHQVLKLLRIKTSWQDLKILQLWEADLPRHREQLMAISETAQGESALEEYLVSVATTWEETSFELVDYQHKCFLIRNWNQLFKQLAENITDLTAMRQSPYYKVFEREALRWEHTLNNAQAILEVFSDVQRRWVYLEGIFSSSIDVQQQLKRQHQRFKAFDRAFVRLMREIKLEPGSLHWFSEKLALLPQLEQHRDILASIQKALGAYLEKQRSQFPRFYFVGDDDLLEIIGNAKDPVKVLRHLPKMFAGIAALQIADQRTIRAMASREGEMVEFDTKIDVADSKSVHDWLRAVESTMQSTLATQLSSCLPLARKFGETGNNETELKELTDGTAAQVVLLASQIAWAGDVTRALEKTSSEAESSTHLEGVLRKGLGLLNVMAEQILKPMAAIERKKYEQLITEVVHERDVVRQLLEQNVNSEKAFAWLSTLRFEYDESAEDILSRISARIARGSFNYGYEYLGVSERLVQTPLTDRCYLTLCEALHMRMGGNPFGPAGTGKTESVKMLGAQLGRFVLVFNCDESFDLKAMGRIFVGLCQCGAWGCFDEFNRLEERILSAVSQQIQVIQEGLKEKAPSIELDDKIVTLNNKMGIFVTMNPGYAGRSNLPDNLKQLFRGMAMMKPDRNLIAQVTLYSQGFRTAEFLAAKIVLLFRLCKDQLSDQKHYDFGLRSLKSVLRSAGTLKRLDMQEVLREAKEAGTDAETADQHTNWTEVEQELLVKSMCMTLVPKLVSHDLGLFKNLLSAVFPGSVLRPPNVEILREKVIEVCRRRDLLPSESWVNKIMELNQVQIINHGVIMVGPSGTGKSTAWRVLLDALELADEGKIKSEYHIIDPKALSKDELYGTLDPTTLEWTNGVFTFILRKILNSNREDDGAGGLKRRHWIVFDGDVDPEWAENLNSVLDDNKLLTLPNGERIMLTDSVRVMFEVQDLNHATPATVSRCGMVWFNPEVVNTNMICSNLLLQLRRNPISGVPTTVYRRWNGIQKQCCTVLRDEMRIQSWSEGKFKDLEKISKADSPLIDPIMEYCRQKAKHIMPLQRMRVLGTLFSLLAGGIARVMVHNDSHADFPLSGGQIEKFMKRYLIMAIAWSFGGSMSLSDRVEFCKELSSMITEELPPLTSSDSKEFGPLIDFDVDVDSGEWELWANKVAQVELDPEKIPKPDVVIETVDTRRHSVVIGAAVAEHRPLILCGPPGSGKSMTLTAVLRSLPGFELITLNFSSSTDPNLLRKTLSHHCVTSRTPQGQVMRPHLQDKWLVIFCDEINLPTADMYGTQSAITFLRQIIEHGGFWDAKELVWTKLERVQIIGACNPPTDAGRVPMTSRFLRHTMLLFVDFPAKSSLKQIYGTFNRALVKKHAALRSYAAPLTEAMVEFYLSNQKRFTPDIHPHYIYSPRELSRWVRGMYEAMDPKKLQGHTLLPEDLVRLFAHEALRLFQDRLVDVEERVWADQAIDTCVKSKFPSIEHTMTLRRPILFSEWLSKRYVSVDQEELRKHVLARLHTFNEEELDVKLVVFDEVLEHILRIDRVLRQPLGHLLLVGASGSGKTILSKFVSWMNGMKTFQIKVHSHYTTKDFDKDLRSVLIRAGCKQEKICFIFDESNVLDTAFLERMNALLASGEVPGLFEGSELSNLMEECKSMGRGLGEVLGSDEERYRRFNALVQRNLHVVFTMNPKDEDFSNRSATSPALFNRCVIDWFGEWSPKALYQVGFDFTRALDLGDSVEGMELLNPDGDTKDKSIGLLEARPGSQRDSVVQTMVYVHNSVQNAMLQLAKARNGRSTYVTPRHYLDFIQHFKQLFMEKRTEFEDQQKHLVSGLQKLKQTEESVASMRAELNLKNQELQAKEREAKMKMEQIKTDSIVAENQRQAAKRIKSDQEKQDVEMKEEKARVEADLAGAGPALEAAKKSVGAIKKRDLDTIRSFKQPPKLVQLAMEPVMMMVNRRIDGAGSWGKIKQTLARADFIPRILAFDTRKLDQKIADYISKKYLSNPNFTEEKVYRASQACGPLVLWVVSQLTFNRVLKRVAPMEKRLKTLEAKSLELKAKQDEIEDLLNGLTSKIKSYSDEHKVLITEAVRIEDELKRVQMKVDRSARLLQNLGAESQRWADERDEFTKHTATLVGDTLLSAAFLAYIGYFNQGYRKTLFDMWIDHLVERGVETRLGLSIIEYLSLPSERLEWKAHQLPDDNLCFENAIMMTKFNRYPLIIDPSGQAISFLMDHFNNNPKSNRKMIRTSFLDSSFLQHLESALRFGNALLVEDVESIDPVLNSVLNREIYRTGGRVMITVGAKEIDFSPKFTIYLSTRDPTCHFTPDLCSRVTFVNFTATHASLASQCLNKVLKCERPEIDQKRSDLLRLQGEFRVELRNLERALLDALNSVKTNILEDDTVMNTLETLKKRWAVVGAKMADSEQVMDQVSEATRIYEPFSRLAAKIYFTLEELSTVHYLYQFSLPFFLQLVDDSMHFRANDDLKALNDDPDARGDHLRRLKSIRTALFSFVFARVGMGLLQSDQMAFALRLAQCSLSEPDIFSAGSSDGRPGSGDSKGHRRSSGTSSRGVGLDLKELNFLLKTEASAYESGAIELPKGLSMGKAQAAMLGKLCKLNGFRGLLPHLAANVNVWQRLIDGTAEAEADIATSEMEETKKEVFPKGWDLGSEANAVTSNGKFRRLLLSKVFRPEAMELAAKDFVECVLGEQFLNKLKGPEMLPTLVTKQTNAGTPILLVTFPGYDASSRVMDLAKELKMDTKITVLAMGSPEGFSQADTAINIAAKKGLWVLLKNVHLAPVWLSSLEKRLHRLEPNSSFRVFMTMELSPKVPSNLVRLSNLMIIEPPRGLKSSMLRIFNGFSPNRVDKAPAERSRLYFLLAWLHSVILERLRYTPVGWTKGFEFSEADQKCALDAIDSWVDSVAAGRRNVRPDNLPWDAIQASLDSVVYGGRIDNPFDQERLSSFVRSLFKPESYGSQFVLANSHDSKTNAMKPLLIMPDKRDFKGFMTWITEEMQNTVSPEYLGLPANAKVIIQREQTRRMLSILNQLQSADHDIERGSLVSSDKKVKQRASISGMISGSGYPSWWPRVQNLVSYWLKLLPDEIKTMSRKTANASSPLMRSLVREIETYKVLHSQVKQDLISCNQVLEGKGAPTNATRNILKSIGERETIPEKWDQRPSSMRMSASSWMQDFIRSLNGINELASTELTSIGSRPIWLGGLLAPAAFVAASRQEVARVQRCALDALRLKVTLSTSAQPLKNDFIYTGLTLHGASLAQSTLIVTNEVYKELPFAHFQWTVTSEDVKVDGVKGEGEEREEEISIPVYLDQTRRQYLFEVQLPFEKQYSKEIFSQRGTCITVWSPPN
mmetsp:Transcript_12145/g.29873  ORF Transcript_12145/g.29873 Transcript_12145/m.29873 type:complete len:4768 (-) Transcript_12145:256-14559(-)